MTDGDEVGFLGFHQPSALTSELSALLAMFTVLSAAGVCLLLQVVSECKHAVNAVNAVFHGERHSTAVTVGQAAGEEFVWYRSGSSAVVTWIPGRVVGSVAVLDWCYEALMHRKTSVVALPAR